VARPIFGTLSDVKEDCIASVEEGSGVDAKDVDIQTRKVA
jgi:hypothetical protein